MDDLDEIARRFARLQDRLVSAVTLSTAAGAAALLVSAERQQSVVQVRTVILIALLAVVRKVLILDLAHATTELFALAAAIIALGAVYWLVRDQDRSIAGEGFARQRNHASRVGRGKKASSSEK